METNIVRTVPPEVQQAKLRFGIVGNAPGLNAAVERAVRVAPIDLSVLVTGESGAGKEFFPQIIHAFSPRKHAKYIAVNCGAIPEGTIDSELFGHEKGAFTGAVDFRKGYFEEASGGTIFLDEVAELPLTTQARLLRVLESGEYLRVGSSEVRRTNVRVVAATNVDLAAAIAEGRFREDLYYRLSTVHITVPPLRDRGNDIRLLSGKFAADFADRYHTPPVAFSAEADALMRHYRWPGNVRQLKNVVDQLSLFEAGSEITPDVLKSYLPEAGEMLLGMILGMQRRIDDLQKRIDSLDSHAHLLNNAYQGSDTNAPLSMGRSLMVIPQDASQTSTSETTREVPYSEITPQPAKPDVRSLEESERHMIEQALLATDGRRKAAAERLGISERTLYRKIKEYGLE